MTRSKRTERLYLADIRDAIDKFVSYTSAGREAFLSDPRTQDAYAVKRIDSDFFEEE